MSSKNTLMCLHRSKVGRNSESVLRRMDCGITIRCNTRCLLHPTGLESVKSFGRFLILWR